MIEAVSSALTTVITWVGSVVTSLTSSEGALKELLPLLAIGVAVSAFFMGIKAIRGVIWGS